MRSCWCLMVVFFFEIMSDGCYCYWYYAVMEKQLVLVLTVMDFAQLGIGGHQIILFMLHLRCVLHLLFVLVAQLLGDRFKELKPISVWLDVCTFLLLGLDETRIIWLFGSCLDFLIGTQLKFMLFHFLVCSIVHVHLNCGIQTLCIFFEAFSFWNSEENMSLRIFEGTIAILTLYWLPSSLSGWCLTNGWI